jgi:hypothetical protein
VRLAGLTLAALIGELSPDVVIVTRHALRVTLEKGSVERASQLTAERYGRALFEGENIKIGLTVLQMSRKA